MDSDGSWAARNRLLVAGLVGLVVAAGMLGLFVALVGGTAVRVLPDASDTPTRQGPDRGSSPTVSPSPTATPTRTKSSPQPRPQEPVLTASPLEAGANERIDLTGRFPGLPEGSALQVERRQGGTWVDFPVSMTAQPDGSFSTYIETGQPGANEFRVTAPVLGRSTPPVTVRIG